MNRRRTRFWSARTTAALFVVWIVCPAVGGAAWPEFAERHRERSQAPPPAGYPTGGGEDRFCEEPFADSLAERREAFLSHTARSPSRSVWSQLVLAERGLPVWRGALYRELLRIDRRQDTADFAMAGVLRLLHQQADADAFGDQLIADAEQCVLDFKYWPDEPGADSMCTWSENHQILFASAGYLAGQRFPDRVFTNSGWTGRQQMERHRPRILRWLDLRFRTGFSEWLSNVYYDADIAALLNLVDFCEDEAIAGRARRVLDLVLTDIACNSFRGCFASTHGRSYENSKKSAVREGTSSVGKICFGVGRFRVGSMSGVAMALSPKYTPPAVLNDIANAPLDEGVVNRQRMGIRVDEAERWGLGFESVEDGMVWLSLEAYAHPRTLPLFVTMLDEFDWWQNKFFRPFQQSEPLLRAAHASGALAGLATRFERDLTRNLRAEANLYTYRTPDYMLSTAQDYRAGYGGDQQSVWQATLGPEAVCFTTHPVPDAKATPDNWTGSGVLPRAAQVENVAIVVYDATELPALYVPKTADHTHAWLPRDRFDETAEQNGWRFARRDDGYLALWCSRPTHWQDQPGEDQGRELIATGRRCVWICELGRRATDGPFDQFVDRIAAAPVEAADLQVSYESPSQGRLEFGWEGPLTRQGQPIPLRDYPRYDNPFVRSPFPAETVEISHGDDRLTIAWPAE